MTQDRRPTVGAEHRDGRLPRARRLRRRRSPTRLKRSIAPAAIERALAIYQQLQPRDQSVIVQARKILTQHIFAMVDRGERDEQRLTVGEDRAPEGR